MFAQQLLWELASNPLQERSHLDTAITFMGAFFGMQNCSKVLREGQAVIGFNLFPGGCLQGWQNGSRESLWSCSLCHDGRNLCPQRCIFQVLFLNRYSLGVCVSGPSCIVCRFATASLVSSWEWVQGPGVTKKAIQGVTPQWMH